MYTVVCTFFCHNNNNNNYIYIYGIVSAKIDLTHTVNIIKLSVRAIEM